MVFTEAKRYYVERRVVERMAATASSSFESYFARLRAGALGEIEQFVNAFTVNETYFYREEHQLSCLTSDLLGGAAPESEDARRSDQDLVGALLDRGGAVLDRDLVARELAARRPLRHRDRRLGHRHGRRGASRARASTASAR